MKHSVILTSYNRPLFVKQAIESVLQQTRSDWELIVVDDGSNDQTRSTINNLIQNDPRASLVNGPEPYPADRSDGCNRLVDCVNLGLLRATGDVIHYLADDDFYDKQRFRAFDELFTNQDVVVGYGKLVYVHQDGRPSGRTRYATTVPDPRGLLDHNQVAHLRRALAKIRGWSRGVYDDYAPDGHFFRKLRVFWEFKGTEFVVAYKREHTLSMQITKKQTGARRE